MNRSSKPIGSVLAAISVACLILWTLFDRGGAYQSTRFVTSILVVCISVGVWILSPRRFVLSPALVLLPCLVWLGGFAQTLSFPASMVRWMSPHSAVAYQEWLPDEIGAGSSTQASAPLSQSSARVDWIPTSVAPDLTRRTLGCLAMFCAVCWLASCWSQSPLAVLVFFLSISMGGSVLAIVGLSDPSRSSFGPFVNNNNAGSFLNLAIGCGFGAVAFLRRSEFRDRVRLVLSTVVWIAITTSLVGLLGTNSRGATLGLFAGALGLCAVVFQSFGKRRVVVLLACTVSLVFLVLTGLGRWSRLLGRVRSLWNADALDDPRVTHWQDGLNACWHYLPGGSGLGTYQYAHLPFQKRGGDRWFVHADGMPVEWLLEGGVWLLLLVTVGIALIFQDVFRIAKKRREREGDALALGDSFIIAAAFVIPALVVTQCFDYGILQPPSFLLLASLVGGLAFWARRCSEQERGSDQPGRIWDDRSRVIVCVSHQVLLLAMLVVSVFDLFVASEVERVSRERIAWLSEPIAETPSRQLAIEKMERLSAFKRSNGTVQLLLANLILDEQRRVGARYLVEQSIDPKRAEAMVSLRTYRRALAEKDASSSWEEMLLPGQDANAWRQARDHTIATLKTNPLSDECRILLIQLESVPPETKTLSAKFLEQLKVLRVGNRSAFRFYEGM